MGRQSLRKGFQAWSAVKKDCEKFGESWTWAARVTKYVELCDSWSVQERPVPSELAITKSEGLQRRRLIGKEVTSTEVVTLVVFFRTKINFKPLELKSRGIVQYT